ncbi:unnamed protein product, partial [Tilletia controversa]
LHLAQSRTHRGLWLLEELEIPYKIVQHKRGADFCAPNSLRDVHPLGKAPVIEDDGKAIAESGAIVEYLIKRPLVRSIYSGITTAMVDPDAKAKLAFVSNHIRRNP